MPNPPSLPLDIKSAWLPLVRRLQSACADNQGFAVLTVRILVDSEGSPRLWTSPEVCKIEPKKGKDDLLTILSQ